MDNTMYYIEVGVFIGLGFSISFYNKFVGNSLIIEFLCFTIRLTVPRKSHHEDTAYPWEWFNFLTN